LLDTPRLDGHSRRDSRHRLERHVNTAEIVPRHEQRKHQFVILPFLRERIRQSRESAILHTDREVRSLDVTCASLARFRVSRILVLFRADYRRRAVPLLSLPGWAGILLNQHTVIDVVSERRQMMG
jgi:hypothetical protein